MSNKIPTIGAYLDDEEKELIEAIEDGLFDGGKSLLTPERKDELQKMARATMNDEREKITLRISRRDLMRIKSKAMQEGMPYQTLINSILHKAVS
jgi:predicted DNA binding CopG/RHH family protein